ncbi:MAG: YceI family protein [Bdellovibrionales bacterium]|nr:YceI family protein [Bdellovibrionales bacterium]
MKHLSLIIIAFICEVSLAAPRVLKQEVGEVRFIATGNPGFLKIEGHGKEAKPTGSVEILAGVASGSIEVPLASLETGIALRDKHMKEKYLKTNQFPKAVFRFENQPLPKDFEIGRSSLKDHPIKGTIEIAGVSHSLTVPMNIDSSGIATTQFEINLNDFKIGVPSFMGVTVAEKVKIFIKTQL